MQSNSVLILDANQQNTEFFIDRFRRNDIDVDVIRSIEDVAQNISEKPALLFMLDYETIVSAQRAEVVGLFEKLGSKKMVVYNVPDLANRRLAFYDLGACRVYDTSVSLPEITQSVDWLLNTLNKAEASKDHFSSGRLEDIPLVSLIKFFGKENRTGVLKIVTKFNSGKIYFYKGDMDAAQVGFHSGDRAVLHMLFWRSGSFSFSSSDVEEAIREVTLSNIGLLLMAEGLRKEYIVNLEEIGPLNAVIRIRNYGDLKATENSINDAFLNFLTRPHPLEEVIENPYYTCFETADVLVRLKRMGFLITTEPLRAATEEQQDMAGLEQSAAETINLSREEQAELKSKLNLEFEKSAKLVILASDKNSKTRFISHISNSRQPLKSEQGMDLGHLWLDSDSDVFLLGITMSEKATDVINTLSEGVSGYIFLVDPENEELFEYANYLVNYLTGLNRVPWAIAVTGTDDESLKDAVSVKFNLNVPVDWLLCATDDPESIRRTLLAIRIHEVPREEKKEQAGETENAEAEETNSEQEEP